MKDCPDIDTLLERSTEPSVAAHARSCAACGAIAALQATRQSWVQRSEPSAQCDRYEVEIASMADGTLNDAARASLVAHLAGCPSCSRLATHIGMFRDVLESVPLPNARSAPEPSPASPRLVPDATMDSPGAGVRTQIVHARRLRGWPWAAAWAAAAAIALAAVVVAIRWRTRDENHMPPSPAVAAGSAIARAAQSDAPTETPSDVVEKPPVASSAPRSEPARPTRSTPPSAAVSHAATAPQPAAEPGYLTLLCNPFCDEVLIGDRALGASPIVKHPLPPGRYEVTVRSGQVVKRLAITITRAQSSQVRVSMEGSSPDDSTAAQGFLTVICSPFCDSVSIDGRAVGPSPVVKLGVAAGGHRVTLRKGRDTKVSTVLVRPGEVTNLRVSMSALDPVPY